MSGKRRAAGPATTSPSGKRGTGGKPPKPPRTRKQKVLSVVKWLLILGLAGFVLAVGAFYVAYRSIDIPDPNKDFQTQTSFVYYADGKTEIGRFATQNRVSIPFREMPQNIKDAVVAAENQTFYSDSGIDPKGILRAALNNAQGEAVQGGSTITQQYVKILYLNQERSYTRKLKEAILALKLDRSESKDQILEGYLNTIYFGHGAYGIQAAAQAYFGVDAKQLSLRQAAVLASVLNNPSGFDPAGGKDNRERLKGRYDYVLGNMAKLGMITSEQADRAERRLPVFPKIQAESTYGGQRGHVLKLVKDELLSIGYTEDQIDGGGLRITTTLTPEAMKAAEDGVKAQRPPGLSDKFLHVAAASVEPGTGALKGFYAGQDYLESQINWATAGGMVGSTFKPVSLAAAITDGYSLKDTFDGNSPYYFPDGLKVRNEGSGPDGLGNDYGSAVNAIYALEQSINTAFVDMTNSMDNGPEKVLRMAEKMGIPPVKPDQQYPGMPDTSRDLEADALITLGKARISAINMANAYATIANGGVRADVHVIDSVTSPDGDDYQYKNETSRAMSSDISDDVSYAMQQVVKAGTGQNALALGRPAAGKTGTATNDAGDVSSSWFAGFTPQLSTAVMYVRGDGDNALNGYLPSYFGADYPTRTWTAIMKAELEGQPVEQFPPPAYVDGTAPQDGHAPVPTPSATPRPTKRPSPSASATPSETASPTPTPTPTPSPTATQPSGCGVLGCPSPSSSPSPSPSGSGTASPAASGSAGPGNGNGRGGHPRVASSWMYAPVSPATLAWWSVSPWFWFDGAVA